MRKILDFFLLNKPTNPVFLCYYTKNEENYDCICALSLWSILTDCTNRWINEAKLIISYKSQAINRQCHCFPRAICQHFESLLTQEEMEHRLHKSFVYTSWNTCYRQWDWKHGAMERLVGAQATWPPDLAGSSAMYCDAILGKLFYSPRFSPLSSDKW